MIIKKILIKKKKNDISLAIVIALLCTVSTLTASLNNLPCPKNGPERVTVVRSPLRA
jgi:hypothetical protein